MFKLAIRECVSGIEATLYVAAFGVIWTFNETCLFIGDNFTDEIYESDPAHCRMVIAPIIDAVYKRENSEVHKLLKSLTQGTYFWK